LNLSLWAIYLLNFISLLLFNKKIIGFLNQPGSSGFKWLLLGWHLIFVFFAWKERVQRGHSDAHYYWAQNFDISHYTWFDFFSYGTDFIVWLNYPFIITGVPFWGGFLLHGLLGYFAILHFIKWLQSLTDSSLSLGNINLLSILAFWPGLHYWTAGLGKEPLLFMCLVQIFMTISNYKSVSLTFIICSVLLLIIRPHVALLLLFAFGASYMFFSRDYLKRKLIWTFIGISVSSILVYMVLQLSHIRYFDWDRIVRFNKGSVLSFEGSGTYVPMEDYSLFYRLVSFYFRPFIGEVNNLKGWIAGFENLVYLLLHLIFIYTIVRYWKKIKKICLPLWWSTAVFLSLYCGSVYIFRYANFGIFMRTKLMYAPFMVAAILWLLHTIQKNQSIENNKA
jgi:hypothetical protein